MTDCQRCSLHGLDCSGGSPCSACDNAGEVCISDDRQGSSKDHLPRGEGCTTCEAAQQGCPGGYPCGFCTSRGLLCHYAPLGNVPALVKKPRKRLKVESFAAPAAWKPGKLASARLEPYEEENETRWRWEYAHNDKQELRLAEDTRVKRRQVAPTTISAVEESVAWDATVDPRTLRRAKEHDVFNNALKELDRPYIRGLPPELLLETMQDDQQALKPANPYEHVGNCLATLPLDIADVADAADVVFHRRGDTHGRPCVLAASRLKQQQTIPGDRFNAVHEDDSDTDAEIDDEDDGTGKKKKIPVRSRWKDRPPLKQFRSPLQQIQSSPLSATLGLVGARTQTGMSLLTVNLEVGHNPQHLVKDVFDVEWRDFAGGRAIQDIALGGLSDGGRRGAGLAVDSRGGLWGWGIGERGFGRIGDPQWTGGLDFWRLRGSVIEQDRRDETSVVGVRWSGENGAVLGLRSEVLLYDLRSPTDKTSLLSPTSVNSWAGPITSLLQPFQTTEKSSASTESFQHVLASETQVILLDSRMPDRRMLSWEHSRVGHRDRPDPNVALWSVNMPDLATRVIALSSPLQAAVTFFAHSSPAGDTPPISLLTPYNHPGLSQRVGLQVDLLRGGDRSLSWRVLEASAGGEVTSRRFIAGSAAPEPLPNRSVELVPELPVQPELHETVNLSRAWKRIFGERKNQDPPSADGWMKRLKQGVESSAAAYERDGGAEIVTGTDLLARANALAGALDDPRHDSADLRRKGRGFLQSSRLDDPSFDLSQVQGALESILDSQATLDSPTGLATIGDVNALLFSEPRSPHTLEPMYRGGTQDDAGSQSSLSRVLLDMSLSSITKGHPNPTFKSIQGSQAPGPNASATRSDAVNLPTLDFSFLRVGEPTPEQELDSDDDEGEAKREGMKRRLEDPGTRLLLSEWSLGTDPAAYEWTNPYIDAAPEEEEERTQGSSKHDRKRRNRRLTQLSNAVGSSQSSPFVGSSQAPPAFRHVGGRLSVGPSMSTPSFSQQRPMFFSQPRPGSETQSQATPDADMGPGESSQAPVMSQALPGVFGARDSSRKKAKKKKRVSGF